MSSFRSLAPLVVAAWCGACASGVGVSKSAHETANTSAVPLVRLVQGHGGFTPYSGVRDSLRTVVRDSVLWRQLWQQIHSPFIPQPALPSIDFSREMIVVAALGARPSGGYDVVLESAKRDSNAIEVEVRRTRPAPGCPVEAVVTQPVDLARIPVAADSVRFRERTLVVPCGSP